MEYLRQGGSWAEIASNPIYDNVIDSYTRVMESTKFFIEYLIIFNKNKYNKSKINFFKFSIKRSSTYRTFVYNFFSTYTTCYYM